MKIAIVLNTSWNIYNFRMGLINSLLNEGHQVIAVAPKDEYSSKLVDAGCEFVEVTMDSRGANPVKDMGLTVELYQIYRKVKPDIVLHYTIKPNIYGTIASTLLKIPTINNVCGLGTVFLKDNLVSLVAIAMYKVAFRFPNQVFFQNEKDLELFLNKKLVSKEISDLLPGSGINLEHFKPVAKESSTPFTFLMISRLIYDKGVSEYVEAIRLLTKQGLNARFQLLGAKDPLHKRGIPLDVIDGWIADGTIEYLGTASDVRPYLKEADCVVLPSYREGAPRTLLEAASVCKPIVATDVPGCNSIVEHGVNGYLCELKNASDLAGKMRLIYNADDKVLHEMGKKGRQKVEEVFDEKIVIRKYLSAINRFALRKTLANS